MTFCSLRTHLMGTVGVFVVGWLSSTLFGQSQVYSFSTFAGANTRAEAVDGVGSAARFSIPSSAAVDGAGNLYIADTGNSIIRKVTPQGVVTTVAGIAGEPGSADGPAASAQFRYPVGIARDAAGNLYVADALDRTLRKITPEGMVSTLAGSAGQSGTADGVGSQARFEFPGNITLSTAGDIYLLDRSADTIRKITPAGVVTTYAGRADVYGSADGTLEEARFNYPQGLVFDAAGNLFVADGFGQTIRKITPAGMVSTFAGSANNYGTVDGTGSAARLFQLAQLTIDSAGNIYAPDRAANTIRKITPSAVVSTIAGKPLLSGGTDGAASAAQFNGPAGIALGNSGLVYVVDQGNNTVRAIMPDGSVSTLAGTTGPVSFADGPGTAARLYYPMAVTLDSIGNVYVADSQNSAVRKINPQGVVSTIAKSLNVGTPTGITLLDTGDLLVTTTSGTVQRISSTGLVTTFVDRNSSFPDNGIGFIEPLFSPQGITSDKQGNVYVADTFNNVLRKITPAGVITNWAGDVFRGGSADGPATSASFSQPSGPAIDASGNIYVADSASHIIRKISPAGFVTTIAGSAQSRGFADGVGSSARFNGPQAVAVDTQGNVFVADTNNSTIRKITPAGVVTTVGGNPRIHGNTNGAGPIARFYNPIGIAVDSTGTLYVADGYNNSIRKGTPAAASPLPVITVQPQSQTVPTGGTAVFHVVASSGTALSYQWYFSGDPIPGATQSSYVVTSVGQPKSGDYSVTVSNAGGIVTGATVTLSTTTATAASQLINISTRSIAGTGSSTQIAGFIISGAADRKVLIRAGGPYLTQYGVDGTLADPVLTLYEGSVAIASNDDWGSNGVGVAAATAKAGATGFSTGSKDAALVATLHPGLPYTAVVTGKGSNTGLALVEVFDADDGNLSRLSNISTRSYVGTGGNIQIAGFILHGGAVRKVLIRAGGPYLTQFGVDNVLTDPVLTVFQGETQIAQNDDWSSNSFEVDAAVQSIGAPGFASGGKDAAMVLTLNPDQPYTAQVAGKNGTSGNALVEMYVLP